MPLYKDVPTAIRVYTVCDESRYLIVKNVPALGCGDELLKLFASYGDVEDFKPMDAEDCESFTDVYWIKFRLVSNSRFAKRKLDEFVFLGNRLQVSYAPQFETLSDIQDKLEGRKKEVLARLNLGNSNALNVHNSGTSNQFGISAKSNDPHITRVLSNQEYFSSNSMNQTVHLVREKLDKIQSSSEHLQAAPASKKARVENRRRI